MTQLTHFSIIIPVYNGAETLDRCLTALIKQDYPQDQYEIIVVNDGSTDETADIAGRYPVRLINLTTNQGRVVARNTGAKAARYETLVFNDVRVIPNDKLLASISQRNYQPLIPEVIVYDNNKWGFSRFFHLLRCKIYAPYYPPSEKYREFQITPVNFDKAPKGTTNLICNRELWLASQPKVADKYTSDDTRILRKMVEYALILRSAAVSVKYIQRTELKKVFRHTLQRGPLFADYYLRPGGRYYLWYWVIWLVLGLILLSVVLQPMAGLLGAGLLLLGVSIVVALYLSQTWADILVVGTCLPIIAGAFGLGILKWQIAQLIKPFTAKQQSPV